MLPQQLKGIRDLFSLRYGDCSNDAVAERNSREELLPLQGWFASIPGLFACRGELTILMCVVGVSWD